MKIEIDHREPQKGNALGHGIVGIRLRPETIEESNILQLFEQAGDMVFMRIPDGDYRHHWLVTPKNGYMDSILWSK